MKHTRAGAKARIALHDLRTAGCHRTVEMLEKLLPKFDFVLNIEDTHRPDSGSSVKELRAVEKPPK